MGKYIYTLTIILALAFSCKKKDQGSQTVNSSSQAGTTTGGTTGGTTTTLTASAGGDYCALQTTYMITNYNGTVTMDSAVFASFYATPPTSVAPTHVYGGTVTLNGVAVPYDNNNISYYSNNPSVFNIAGTLAWSVSGSGTVTPFAQSFTPVYPKYTGGNLLPDTCVKASGVTINISGVTNNQNSVVVYLIAGSASSYKYFFGSNGSVTFTSADLANYSANQPLTIMINFGNFYSVTHNGIKHGFSNTLNYQKISYLK